jgi:hypothetical protein
VGLVISSSETNTPVKRSGSFCCHLHIGDQRLNDHRIGNLGEENRKHYSHRLAHQIYCRNTKPQYLCTKLPSRLLFFVTKLSSYNKNLMMPNFAYLYAYSSIAVVVIDLLSSGVARRSVVCLVPLGDGQGVPPAAGHVLRLPLPVGAGAGLRLRQVDGHLQGVARCHLPAVSQTAMITPTILSKQKGFTINMSKKAQKIFYKVSETWVNSIRLIFTNQHFPSRLSKTSSVLYLIKQHGLFIFSVHILLLNYGHVFQNKNLLRSLTTDH